MDAVIRGDRLWFGGDRRAACAAWREALGASPAAEAMARLRLLRFAGNWGGIVHGPAIDRALGAGRGAWGALAWADYHLLAPPQVGADPSRSGAWARRALRDLPGPAAARLWLATGDPTWRDVLAGAPWRDGLGEGLLAAGGHLPEGPGTWFLGIGFGGAPGEGFGVSVRWVHPDLLARGWTADLQAGGTSRGLGQAGAGLRVPGRVGGSGRVDASRLLLDHWEGDQVVETLDLLTGRVRLGAVRRWRRLGLEAGGQLRWDDVLGDAEGPLRGHGPYLVAALRAGGADGPRLAVRAGMEGAWLDYEHLLVWGEVRGVRPAAGGALAARVLWQQAPFPGTPLWRLPTAGGSGLLRGAPAGRFRAPWIGAADLEHRLEVRGPWRLVLFLDGAWVAGEGPHGGGGVGVRLVLPPEAYNVVRVDLAVTDVGWGLTAGWGEVF